jgi:phosphoglycerate dehydrogenase-like enzyme
LDRCRFILRPYVGYDDIDVDALTSRGILLANIPDAFSEEVAVHALALILAFNRFLFQVDRYVREGAYWARRGRADLPIHHPKALTLGIIGFGTIGQLLAERAKPLGFRMLAYDPFPAHEVAQRLGVTFSSLEKVLDQSDYLSLHVFLNTQTEHLMNEDRLHRMKRGAFLINTSRGKVVDERALVRVLESGHLGGAGLDVFEEEPISPNHPLTRFPHVILTPHMASQSVEGAVRIRERANEILQQVALGNLPERKVVVNKSLFDAITALSAYKEQVQR